MSKLKNKKFNTRVILYILFGYIILQFLWWEILLVKLNNELVYEKQKLIEISISNELSLQIEIKNLHNQKLNKTLMIVGEGTIFLLLLLYGINKIRQAKKREDEYFNQKNNFLLSITHELKTPLATTKLQLQTLKKHQLPIEKQKELIESAINENERLNILIDNVLMSTRMQQNEYTISTQKTDISEFIERIVHQYYKNEIEKNLIHLDIEPFVFLDIDKISFPSILINLIDNAIKYSEEFINITIRVKKAQDNVCIEIMDKGIGISDAEKKQVFNQFYRSGNEEVRKTKGTGLGLFIVDYLVKLHKGIITILDNKPSGTIVKINFNK